MNVNVLSYTLNDFGVYVAVNRHKRINNALEKFE